MDELILGIDLGSEQTRASLYRPDSMEPADLAFPQAEGRNAVQSAAAKTGESGRWLIGREAYEAVLGGEGEISDHLGSNPQKEALAGFFDAILSTAFGGEDRSRVRAAVCLQNYTPGLLIAVRDALVSLGIPEERQVLISRSEAFAHYVLSQPRDMWLNTSVLFDWTGESLCFYEMNVVRGVKPNQVRVTRRVLEEDLSDELLESPAGKKLADSRLNAHALRLLGHHPVSSCFLTGRGMSTCGEWGSSFLRVVGFRNKVYGEDSLFARGAAYAAGDMAAGQRASSFTLLCEGRLTASVLLECSGRGGPKELSLAREGDLWFGKTRTLRIIPENKEYFDLKISRSGERLFRCERIGLSGFPDRPKRTGCMELNFSCLSDREALIELKDLGFGEIFPAGNFSMHRVVRID